MKKTPYVILFLLSITFCWVNCSSKGAKSTKKETYQTKTNIILLMGDDHGWEETGYNGHPYIKTPTLDDMAKNGLVFNRFYSAHPSCSPTRGSIITGRHPNRYGVYTPGWSIRPEEISIAQLLKSTGYTTGHFGKWHLGPVKKGSPTNPGAMGFDTWVSHDNFFELDPVLSKNGAPPVQIKGESSEVVIDETIAFIDEVTQSDKPFFSVVWFGSPHEPYEALPEDLALYNNLPDSLSNEYVQITSLKTGKQVRRPLDSVLPARYAEITAMDRAIGKLRAYLTKKGLKENTLIWYCGDNGIPSSGLYHSNLRGLKGTVYEGGTKVPGIVEWPQKIKQPMVSEVNAVTTDIFLTVCDIAGVAVPKRPLDGVNLVPIVVSEVNKRPKPIVFWNFDTKHLVDSIPYIAPELQEGTTPLAKISEGKFTRSFKNFHHHQIDEKDYLGDRSILDNDYKLIIDDRKGDLVKELYNVREDSGETKNIIEQYPDVASQLEQQMREWQESVLLSLAEQDYKR
tara:strand:- start:15893 stop:17425 length:1533 start_codon:yes stop_codon:yes gene_type:complete